MKCPVCTGVDLKMSERQGVEIDYCPECRGVWLDRGELDKIIERSEIQPSRTNTQPQFQHSDHKQQHYGKEHNNDHSYSQQNHRKKSWISDLFD